MQLCIVYTEYTMYYKNNHDLEATMKLGNKILILMIVSILVAVLSTSVLGYNVSKSSNSDLSNKVLEESTQVAIKEISGWIKEKRMVVDTTSKLFSETFTQFEDIEDHHLKIFEPESGILSVYTVFKDGSVRDCAGWRPDAGDDLRSRDYYVEAMARDGVYYSNVYLDSDSKQYVATLSRAVKSKGGTPWGIVALDVSLGAIGTFLEGLDVYDGHGEIVLISSDGSIMYHPNAAIRAKNISEVEHFTATGEKIQQTAGTLQKVTYENQAYTLYADQIPEVNWSIALMVPDDTIYASTNKLRSYFLTVAVILILAGLAVSFVYSKRLKRDFLTLDTYIEEISNYNLRYVSERSYDKRSDEIGSMYRRITVLKNSFTGLIHDIKASSGTLMASSEQLDTGAENISRSSHEISRTVEELAKGAVSQAENTEIGATEVMSLGDIIERNTALNEVVLSANKNVKSAVDDGLHIVDALVALSKENQEASEEILRVVQTTEENSRKINTASEMIASIADQTNLLALNAAIEAARAGESGKGFAVVAEEIRKLAEESSESTKHISDAVSQLLESATHAVDRMKDIAQIVENQNTKVEETKGKYALISSATTETGNAIEELYSSGQRIDEKRSKLIEILESLAAIAEENAASTEETSASTQEQADQVQEIAEESKRLVTISEKLTREIEKFKI